MTLFTFCLSIWYGIQYGTVYKPFLICSDWTKFLAELTFLRRIFCKNGYPENFIGKCFTKFLDDIRFFKEKVPTMERKPLLFVLPWLEVISSQTISNLQEAFKGVLKCCKIEIPWWTPWWSRYHSFQSIGVLYGTLA